MRTQIDGDDSNDNLKLRNSSVTRHTLKVCVTMLHKQCYNHNIVTFVHCHLDVLRDFGLSNSPIVFLAIALGFYLN